MAEGGNYSFFNRNLRTAAMKQSFDRPKLLHQRQSQSAGNRSDSSSSHNDKVLLVKEVSDQNVKFAPHPPTSPRSNSRTSGEGSPRLAALNSKGIKRTHNESPRNSASESEDERRSHKHVPNVALDPLPLKRRGSTGSLDSIGSNESFGSPRDKNNRSINRNLRGIQPLKDIGSEKDLVYSFKSNQNSVKNDDFVKKVLKKNVVHPLRVEPQQVKSTDDISTQTESTYIHPKSERSIEVKNETPADDETTLSSSNDSLTSVSDDEENSLSVSNGSVARGKQFQPGSFVNSCAFTMAAGAPPSPRFESDKEDGEDSKSRKLVFDGIDAAAKCDGVDVDKRMLDGRKANRGFTISTGTSADPDFSSLRNSKRAQTLPADCSRRGDFEMSEDSKKQLEELQKHLLARYRHGSVSVVFDVVPQEVLDETFKNKVVGHSHGLITEGQQHGDERERVVYGTIPLDPPPLVACQKGCKGFKDTSPNQDNFSVTHFKSGYTLVCTFDGHGPFGHIVSTRTVQTVPWFMVNESGFDKDTIDEACIEKALINAFEKAQKDVVAHSLENDWDVQASGSTAVAALFKGNKVWTANAGDSRCAIGSEADKKVIFETEDHKPQSEKEKARIESMGGEVRSQTYPDGWVNHRIFIKGKDYPGLCMARTLGDQSVKDHGVVATPEVVKTEVDLGKKVFFIIASDGVWEFLDSQFVVKAVAKKIQSDGPAKTLEKLQREAKKRWKAEEGDYCDDITSVLVQLR